MSEETDRVGSAVQPAAQVGTRPDSAPTTPMRISLAWVVVAVPEEEAAAVPGAPAEGAGPGAPGGGAPPGDAGNPTPAAVGPRGGGVGQRDAPPGAQRLDARADQDH